MKDLTELYSDSLSLLTDLYQLTAAYGYWKNKIHEKNAVFHLFYRKNPFKGNYAIVAGLEYVIHFLNNFQYRAEDLAYLATLNGSDGKALFDKEFLEYLGKMKFSCTVDAIPEGTVVFANEPLLRIRGPIIQCQLLETILLNIINFQILIATKAARICIAAERDKVIEFGLRRAQGIDGGVSASRACYIGGCAATSNVLAGKLFDIPVIGTHAHSWVMSFPSEEKAFEAYAQAMPNNCVFLVDTFDTKEGVKQAIQQGLKLRRQGFEINGIRLDSGDLCQLSIEARKMLDQAGFSSTAIIASNDLDEYKIAELKKAGAKINCWGVGTQMVTSADQSALGGVYKLGAIEESPGNWVNKIKLSNNLEKITNPGVLEVWRFCDKENYFYGDMIANQGKIPTSFMVKDNEIRLSSRLIGRKLLQPIFKDGIFVGQLESLKQIRKRVDSELDMIPVGDDSGLFVFRLDFVFLEKNLYQLKEQMIQEYQVKV